MNIFCGAADIQNAGFGLYVIKLYPLPSFLIHRVDLFLVHSTGINAHVKVLIDLNTDGKFIADNGLTGIIREQQADRILSSDSRDDLIDIFGGAVILNNIPGLPCAFFPELNIHGGQPVVTCKAETKLREGGAIGNNRSIFCDMIGPLFATHIYGDVNRRDYDGVLRHRNIKEICGIHRTIRIRTNYCAGRLIEQLPFPSRLGAGIAVNLNQVVAVPVVFAGIVFRSSSFILKAINGDDIFYIRVIP